MIHGVVDRLAGRYADGEHKGEAITARQEYFDRGGKVFDDDAELFETRMASFLEWYILERPFQGGDAPVIRALEEGGSLPPEERRAMAQLAASHRSVFDVCALSGGVVDLEDVVGGSRFAVVERRGTRGLEVGDLFEARLFWDGQAVVFGKTFLFHPHDAREAALDTIEAAVRKGVARDEIIFQMSRMHVRWHRYGHVGAARIYRDGA